MRDLQCLMPTMNDEGKFTFFPGIFVEIETCFNFSRIPVPVLVEDCNFNVPCPVRFSPGPFREVFPVIALVSQASCSWGGGGILACQGHTFVIPIVFHHLSVRAVCILCHSKALLLQHANALFWQ